MKREDPPSRDPAHWSNELTSAFTGPRLPTQIEVRYWRPPNRLQVFTQELVVDRPECKVTYAEGTELIDTLRIEDSVIFEAGAPMIWFVFPGRWYDVGRFHLKDGSFTGYYGNLITPPRLGQRAWEIFDLCLDFWVDPAGGIQVLDQDEFDEALENQWIDQPTAERARQELERLISETRDGRWPPAIAREYDLESIRAIRSAHS